MDYLALEVGERIVWTPTPGVIAPESTSDAEPEKQIVYEIQRKLSTDKSYGLSYLAVIVSEADSGERVFIKTPNVSPHLPRHEKQRILREIGSSFEAELDAALRLSDLTSSDPPIVAGIRRYGHYARTIPIEGAYRIPFLVQDYIDQKNMEEFFLDFDHCKYAPDGEFKGITEPAVWFSLAQKIVDIVRRIHNRQIIHGDIAPKNILLRAEGESIEPILVDFGRSFQLDVASVTGSLKRRDDPYVAPESRAGGLDWYTPADIYSLGGVLYFMGTGKPPPDILKSPHIFREEGSWMSAEPTAVALWKQLIQEYFLRNTELTERNEGIVKVVDKCLRPSPLDRYTSTERIVHALDAMNFGARKHVRVTEHLKTLSERWSCLESSKEFDSLFAHILSDKLDLTLKELTDMERDHFEIYGEREELIDTLVKYMGILQAGDVYVTVTVPNYWTEQNLGVNGRFLTINKDLVKNGVFLNRLFLLAPEDVAPGSHALEILRAHKRALHTLQEKHRASSAVFPNHPHKGSLKPMENSGKMFSGYLKFSDSNLLKEFQRQSNHVAILSRGESGQKLSITFESQPSYGIVQGSVVPTSTRIVKVRFRRLRGNFEYEQMTAMFDGENVRSLSEMPELLEGEP